MLRVVETQPAVESGPLTLVAGPTPIRPKTFVTTRRQIDAYLRIKRSTGAISRHTESEFGYILSAFADHCPDDPAKITRRTVIRWMRTTEHLSANTRRQYHNRVRGFTSWLLRRGVIRKDPFEEITGPRVPRAMHRALSVGQAKALLAACETARETVVVILGLHLGLRRCEMAGLEVGDVDLAARTIFVRHGKGGHERVLPLSVEACWVIGDYMVGAGTGTALRSGPLLRSLKNPGAGLTPATIGEDSPRSPTGPGSSCGHGTGLVPIRCGTLRRPTGTRTPPTSSPFGICSATRA